MLRQSFCLIFSFLGIVFQVEAVIPLSPTNVCWKCIFPMEVGAEGSPICSCREILSGKTVGASIRFWDPAYIVDVTPEPYNFVALGSKTSSRDRTSRGYFSSKDSGGMKRGFFHVHIYRYPILKIIGFLLDSDCLDDGDIDIGYISEVDPTWSDDALCSALFPDAKLVAYLPAQLACASDCIAASKDSGIDSLHWCGGCQGSVYPLVGHVDHMRGPVQASSLLVHRLVSRLHRSGFLRGRSKGEYCVSKRMPLPPKSDYKLQMISPVAERRSSHALGASEMFWGSGKVSKTNDYSFILWKRRRCCLDIPQLVSSVSGV